MGCPEVHLFLLMLMYLPVAYKEAALWDKEDTFSQTRMAHFQDRFMEAGSSWQK